MKWTIGKRINFGFGTIMSIVLLSSILNLLDSSKVDSGISLSDTRFAQLSLFSELKYKFKNTTLAYMDAIIDADSGTVDMDIQNTHKDFSSYIQKNKRAFRDAVDTKEEHDNLNIILKNIEVFTKAGGNLLESITSKAGAEAMGAYDDKIDAVADETAKVIALNVASIQEEYNEASIDLRNSNNLNMTIQWISLFLVMTMGITFAFFIVKKTNTILIKITEDISSASTHTASASRQLSESSQELSSGANEQAASIEETSSSLEEISEMISNNVSNSESAAEQSDKVKTISEKGNQSIGQLQVSMKDILESNEKIEDLVKVIGNIGEKTQVMDEIVFQTKLLSFNASVEAERAGEHGRGFAVVAQEVGNLAQMSGKAAQEIAEIVNESIRDAETITTENKKRVEQGNSFVIETAQVLKDIMESSVSVSERSNQVLSASKEQSNGIKQITIAMGQLDKATQENAAAAEETAATSDELNTQTESLQQSVGELIGLI